MRPALKLGYKASAEQFAPRELLNFAIEAEQAGFDSVFVSDHLQPWRHSDGHMGYLGGEGYPKSGAECSVPGAGAAQAPSPRPSGPQQYNCLARKSTTTRSA